MGSNPTGRSQPLAYGVTRTFLCVNLAVVAVMVVSFGFAARWLSAVSTRSFVKEQARLCTAALVPGPDGDLTTSVEHLWERYSDLVAVATLDAVGNLHTVLPERPAYRRAALAVLADSESLHEIIAPDTGERLLVAGASMPLVGASCPAAQHVVILLNVDGFGFGWAWPTLIFAVVATSAALLGVGLMRRWLDRRVMQPLRSLTAAGAPAAWVEKPAAPEPERWQEFNAIAHRFARLLKDVEESEADAVRMAHQVEHRLQQRERGLDQQLRRAKDQATMDPLTLLRNRSYVEEELEPLFRHFQGKSGDLAAVMFDVDNFKQFNDAHGHQQGDALMRFVGALLRGAIRPTDTAVRYGGDEFLLILPNTDASQARAVAERLIRLFGQYAKRLGQNHGLSMSAGVATLRGDVPTGGDDLVAKADAALYAAKRNGKSQVAGPRPANPGNTPARSPASVSHSAST